MVKVTFEFDTKEEAAAFLAGGKKSTKKGEDSDDLTGDDLTGDDPEDEVDHAMIGAKVKELVAEDKANKPKIEALLKKYKVAGTSKLPDDKLKAFMAALIKIG